MTHDHGHHHDHHHDHDHEKSSSMTLEEKLATLFGHWVDHNDSHKDNFLSWAQKARTHGLKEVAALLEEAGRLSEDVTKALEKARDELGKS